MKTQRPYLSLMDPRFNLREVVKQMLLLEDHLAHPSKHCPDCICKHLLTIEALSEEAVSLDVSGRYRVLCELCGRTARRWMEAFLDQQSPAEIGQKVRQVRKYLMPRVADPREAIERVAARYLQR